MPIYAIYGTQAEALKIAPVLSALCAAGQRPRLIETGQHAHSLRLQRRELGLDEPRIVLAGDEDVIGIGQFARWILRALRTGIRQRAQIFDAGPGICLLQGDTPSTLIGWLVARSMAGMRIAHVESGYSSGRWWRPFPEEMIRRVCTRFSDWRFTIGAEATERARRHGRGHVIDIGHNTGLESLFAALDLQPDPEAGAAVFTIHRVETLLNPRRIAFIESAIAEAVRHGPVEFVLHGSTRHRLRAHGTLARLAGLDGLSLIDRSDRHREFVRRLRSAPFVVTDSAGIQEECAWLGTPCLVLRKETERPDGLGENVRLCAFDPDAYVHFLAEAASLRRPPRSGRPRPSDRIVEELLP